MNSKNPWPWATAKPDLPSLSEQLARSMLRGKRVLFLDDDQSLGYLVQTISEKYDLKIVHVTTSGEARTQLESDQPFDAAILDVNVANGNGIALYRWLKRIQPRLQVIFLTGLDATEVAERVHAIGSAPVYSKPSLWNTGFMEDLFEKLGCRKKAIS